MGIDSLTWILSKCYSKIYLFWGSGVETSRDRFEEFPDPGLATSARPRNLLLIIVTALNLRDIISAIAYSMIL